MKRILSVMGDNFGWKRQSKPASRLIVDYVCICCGKLGAAVRFSACQKTCRGMQPPYTTGCEKDWMAMVQAKVQYSFTFYIVPCSQFNTQPSEKKDISHGFSMGCVTTTSPNNLLPFTGQDFIATDGTSFCQVVNEI